MSGPKIGGPHTTAIDAAVPLVFHLVAQDKVETVVLGYITSTRPSSERRLKIFHELTGIRCRVRGSLYVQEIRVFMKKEDQRSVRDGLVTEAIENLHFSVIIDNSK